MKDVWDNTRLSSGVCEGCVRQHKFKLWCVWDNTRLRSGVTVKDVWDNTRLSSGVWETEGRKEWVMGHEGLEGEANAKRVSWEGGRVTSEMWGVRWRGGGVRSAGHLYLQGWEPEPAGCRRERWCPRYRSARPPPPADAPVETEREKETKRENTFDLKTTHLWDKQQNHTPFSITDNLIFCKQCTL